MLDLFNKLNDKYDKLDTGNRNGSTDYIDYLDWDEVKYPIMCGIDKFNRPFFVLKFIINDDVNSKYMQTYFQRYTNDKYVWQACGHATPEIISSSGGIDKDQIKFLEAIINGNIIECTDEISYKYRINRLINNKKIRLMTDKDA